MSEAFVPLRAAYTRVFTIEGAARADHAPVFRTCWRATGLEKGLGDVEPIECPSASSYGSFVDIGEIQGSDDRPTTSLIGRYAADKISDMLRIGKKRCRLDVQIHMGECTDPSDFNTFTKAVIFEDAVFTNYSTDDVGALSSDENAVVNETVDLSGRRFYEVVQLSAAERGGDTVTVELVDVVICDNPACGDCGEESDGCEDIYAVSVASAGSVGTAPDVVYSNDRGVTWAASDVNSLLPAENADALACLGTYIVVVSNDSNSLHYALKTDVDSATAINVWTEVATGFVATKEPNDIWSVGSYAFIVGDGGYVYGTSDPTVGVAVLDAGVATTNDLRAVHAIDSEFAVAVGDSDTIIYTTDGTTWQAASGNTGTGDNLLCVWIKSELEWHVGTSGGAYYYTINGGVTWSPKGLPGTYDEVPDIAFSTNSIGYAAANTSGPRGRVLRTYSGAGGAPDLGGFVQLPEGAAILPLADDINAVAACVHDPNFVVAVGLGDNGTDGIIIVLSR
jgi:photosystem II stability/assembly factor-like uncharacterized protein